MKAWKKICAAVSALRLADKCLLVFMVILLAQSGHNLFSHEPATGQTDTFDVIVRTTAAAIFGYFISANFQHSTIFPAHGSTAQAAGETARAMSAGARASSKIGFGEAAEPSGAQVGRAHGAAPDACPTCTLQILVVAGIGVFALLALLVSRNNGSMTAQSAATISQLRDFVSGSVGFLIGDTTQHVKSA